MRKFLLLCSIIGFVGLASAQGPNAKEPKSIKAKITSAVVADLPPCIQSGIYDGGTVNPDGTITVTCLEAAHCCIRARKEKSHNRTVIDAYDENGNVVATYECTSTDVDDDGNVVLQQASIVR